MLPSVSDHSILTHPAFILDFTRSDDDFHINVAGESSHSPWLPRLPSSRLHLREADDDSLDVRPVFGFRLVETAGEVCVVEALLFEIIGRCGGKRREQSGELC